MNSPLPIHIWPISRPLNFDTSKIPEIYDNIYYDLTHRREELEAVECIEHAEKIFNTVLPLNCWFEKPDGRITLEAKWVPKSQRNHRC